MYVGRWAGMYIFERDKEVILHKSWNMLHYVFIYWPSRFLYEPFYNIMINNNKFFEFCLQCVGMCFM
jgi:hypothetical protein